MTKKKNNYTEQLKENEAAAFVSVTEEEEREIAADESARETITEEDAPGIVRLKYEYKKPKKELKTVRAGLLLTPSLNSKLRAAAQNAGISFNELVTDILERAFEE